MKRFVFLFLFSVVFAADKTICLNMIVKDEASIITRCLESVKPYIDYWVIVDTGSTDGTQDVIREFMKDIPGELHESEWVNFGYNRNEAMQWAKGKGDYLLFIDADEVLSGKMDKEALHDDVYLGVTVLQRNPVISFKRALLINNELDWSWKGVIHETLQCEGSPSYDTLWGMELSAEAKDGNRAKDPKKYMKDAKALEVALENDPNNSETVYYLAQSYYMAKEYELALKNFLKRAQMDGWDQQTFWSKYYSGHIQELLGMSKEAIVNSYCDAYQFRPTRAEPLMKLANMFYNQGNYIIGFLLAKEGLKIPKPDDIVYVEEWVYDYGLAAVFANCAQKLGKHDLALTHFEKVAGAKTTPEFMRQEAGKIAAYLKESLSSLHEEPH
jgi:glycosyltransferase involved in cell wall biosynthesis